MQDFPTATGVSAKRAAHVARWAQARPTSVPIMQTATFAQTSATGFDAYDYSRSGNPTRAVLEEELARLEGGARAFAFASGMAAIAAALAWLGAGDVLLLGDDLYGGTVRYAERVLAPRGVAVQVVRAATTQAWRAALERAAARHVVAFLELPTNPLLRIVDLPAIAQAARASGATVIVDNTALSPHWLNPLALGADAVVHSATKHLGGHGDVTAGAVVTADTEGGGRVAEHVGFVQNAEGTALAPFDSWLLLRGMQTLGVRLDRAGEGALAVAHWLHERVGAGAITRVLHPGLADHPGHARLRELVNDPVRGFGTLIAFTTGAAERSRRLVEAVQRFTIAVSFGNVASSISLPCYMSHASVPDAAARPPSDLVRLSIGIEPSAELIADLEQALAAAGVSGS